MNFKNLNTKAFFILAFVISLLTFSLIWDNTSATSMRNAYNTDSYPMDTDLSTVNPTFLGEANDDRSGYCVAGAGDVNGDGYDDFLVGANRNDEGPGNDNAGQTYLIFGKASGWSMDISLANADASFIGEAGNDWSGHSVAGAGDVNEDGYDDFLVGAPGSQNGGQTYLIGISLPSTSGDGGGGGGGGGASSVERTIPFGDYYLIIILLEVISIILYTKRKVIFN